MDPLDAVSRIFPKEPVSRSGSSKITGLRPEAEAELTDAVDFNSESLVDAVRVQAGLLQNELPGIISEMLLAPAEGEIVRQDPVNNLLFRLNNPLESVLGKLPQEQLSEELILSLQQEVTRLKNEIPNLAQHELLAKFSDDLSRIDPLNNILGSLSTQLDDLIVRLGDYVAPSTEA